MKVLAICQYYWPEPYPSADVCEELVKRGHEVHIVTGIPNYPMGNIYPEYRKGKLRRQTKNGVEITRTFTVGRRQNKLSRFLNYYSYAISSTLYTIKAKKEYDVVFVHQTSPVMMAYAALAYAKIWKKRVVLYCVDLWPASLAAGGIDENSWIYKYYRKVSENIYRRADRILISSHLFKEYLISHYGIPEERIAYHPQYAVGNAEASVSQKNTDGNSIDLMFAGNIGAAQSLMTLIEAADILRKEKNLRWHIVGEGSELVRLKSEVKKRSLGNVLFYGRRPLEEMPEYYAIADAMIVTLTADPYISLTLPQKVQSYMAAGKPIIAAANGETASVIRQAECGFCACAQDAEGLSEAVRKFMLCGDKEALGKNARAYYEKNFERMSFFDRLEKELSDQLR